MQHDVDADLRRRQTMFLLFLLVAALAFAVWQASIPAGVFMFFALYLLAP